MAERVRSLNDLEGDELAVGDQGDPDLLGLHWLFMLNLTIPDVF